MRPGNRCGDVGWSYLRPMKDYAQPIATTLLAVAIASLPFTLPLANAQIRQYGTLTSPVFVKHLNSCSGSD